VHGEARGPQQPDPGGGRFLAPGFLRPRRSSPVSKAGLVSCLRMLVLPLKCFLNLQKFLGFFFSVGVLFFFAWRLSASGFMFKSPFTFPREEGEGGEKKTQKRKNQEKIRKGKEKQEKMRRKERERERKKFPSRYC